MSFTPTPTGTGVRKVNAGVETSTASTIVDADVNGGAAIAVAKLAPSGTNGQVLTTTAGVAGWAAAGGGASAGATSGQVQTGDGVGGFTAPTNVLAGSGYISVAATPATAGALRVGSTGGLRSRNAANTQDLYVVSTDAADNLYIGTGSSFTGATQCGNLNIYGAGNVYSGVGGSTYTALSAGNVENWKPIIGSGTGSSPYGVHGGVAVSVTAATQALTAAQYAYDMIKLSTTTGAAFTVTAPAPASIAAGYYKHYWNTSAFTATISTGAGTTRALASG
jgi:hypothetical protein